MRELGKLSTYRPNFGKNPKCGGHGRRDVDVDENDFTIGYCTDLPDDFLVRRAKGGRLDGTVEGVDASTMGHMTSYFCRGARLLTPPSVAAGTSCVPIRK